MQNYKVTENENEERDSQVYEIKIKNFSFQPNSLVITCNSSVRFTIGDN